MSNKILIAVDTSENAMKAVKYAAMVLGRGSKITLYHVFFKSPHLDLQEGEILSHHHLSSSGSTEEFNNWLMTQRLAVEDSLDGIATDILNKVKEGGYDTLIMGRRGMSRAMHFFSGSVTAKIMNHAENCTVWIVD